MNGAGGIKRSGGPFIMHLERVVRLIEMGQRFVVEINPNSDVYDLIGRRMLEGVRLEIADGGRLLVEMANGVGVSVLRLTLANYKRVWRCWQNGVPDEDLRRGVSWG